MFINLTTYGETSLPIPQIPPAPSLPLSLPENGSFVFAFDNDGMWNSTSQIRSSKIPIEGRSGVAMFGRTSGAMGIIWFLKTNGEVLAYEPRYQSYQQSFQKITLPSFFDSNIAKFYAFSSTGPYIGILASGQMGVYSSPPAGMTATVFQPEWGADVVEVYKRDGLDKYLSLHSSGVLKCWQVSPPPNSASLVSHIADQLTNVRMVDGGAGCGLAINANGQVFGWNSENQFLPIPSAASSGVVQVVAPTSSDPNSLFYALKNDGSIVYWDMQGNQLSLPTSFSGKQFVSIATMDMGRAFGLTREGKLMGWSSQGGVIQELSINSALSSGLQQISTKLSPDNRKYLYALNSQSQLLSLTDSPNIEWNIDPNLPPSLFYKGVSLDGLSIGDGAASSTNFILSSDGDLAVQTYLGLPLDVLVKLVADKIMNISHNYGLATQTAITTATSNLVNQSQITSLATKTELANALTQSRTDGINSVISNPNLWTLYTTNQIKAMAMGDLVLTRTNNGQFLLNYDIEQSDDLASWHPYQNFAMPLTNLPTDKAFVRIKVKNQP